MSAAEVMQRRRPTRLGAVADPAAETDHRIANSLALIVSLVKTHARAVSRLDADQSPQQVSLLLEEVAGRIETVGRLHRLLSRSGAEAGTDLSAYLQEVCDGLLSALSSAERFNIVHVPTGGCIIPARQAVPLGLIVCELVTNSVKYSHPANTRGDVGVACGREPDGTLFVEVADDGVGLPEGFDPAKDGGYGLRLVRGLAQQLNASCAFHNHGLGLRFRLVVPASELEMDA